MTFTAKIEGLGEASFYPEGVHPGMQAVALRYKGGRWTTAPYSSIKAMKRLPVFAEFTIGDAKIVLAETTVKGSTTGLNGRESWTRPAMAYASDVPLFESKHSRASGEVFYILPRPGVKPEAGLARLEAERETEIKDLESKIANAHRIVAEFDGMIERHRATREQYSGWSAADIERWNATLNVYQEDQKRYSDTVTDCTAKLRELTSEAPTEAMAQPGIAIGAGRGGRDVELYRDEVTKMVDLETLIIEWTGSVRKRGKRRGCPKFREFVAVHGEICTRSQMRAAWDEMTKGI